MGSKKFRSLAPGFLLATPTLLDPNFQRTVVLLFHHTPEGAIGLVINRSSGRRLGELLEQANLTARLPALCDLPIQIGGPVAPGSGWIVFEGDDPTGTSFRVQNDLRVTGSLDLFKRLLEEGPSGAMAFMLGYSGWGPGQLDREMEEGAWLTAPVTREILFERPMEARWRHAYLSLGINPDLWTPTPGEA